jgi:hypothetical protein
MGMFTFVPGMMGMYSPYGFAFFSPFDVYMAYAPGYYYSPGAYGYGSGGGGGGAYNILGRSNAVPVKGSLGGSVTSGMTRVGSSSSVGGHGSLGGHGSVGSLAPASTSIGSISASSGRGGGGFGGGSVGGGGGHH